MPWRNISGLLTSGWSGDVRVRREGGWVTYQINSLVRGNGAISTALSIIPGCVPLAAEPTAAAALFDGSTPMVAYRARVTQYGMAVAAPEGVLPISGTIRFHTERSFPPESTWPGTPVD